MIVSRFTVRPDLEVRDFIPEDETGVQALLAAGEDYFVAATGSASAPGLLEHLGFTVEAPEQARHQNRNLGPGEPPVLRAQMHLRQK